MTTEKIIKCEMIGSRDIILFRMNKPVWGGDYGIKVIDHNNHKIVSDVGYCLDAAIDVYNEITRKAKDGLQ